jgi:F420H(2)-dependent quinone reductase
MSDENDFNERNIAEFRANHGRVGGQFDGAPLVILHTVGACSGKPRTNIVRTSARLRGPSPWSRSRRSVGRSRANESPGDRRDGAIRSVAAFIAELGQ